MAQLLVIEDDERIRSALIRAFRERGHAVSSAGTALAGLKQAVDERPDLVLLDLGLPGMDAYEVARRLRGGRAVVVAMTGYGQPEDLARTDAAGFAAHLVKPPDLDRIRALLGDLPADEER